MSQQPKFMIVGGPNGAGKSTAAARLLPSGMTYVNADEVAKGLPNYPSQAADLEAGRIVLETMDSLADRREDFAVETTLAGVSLAARASRLRKSGYLFRLIISGPRLLSSRSCVSRLVSDRAGITFPKTSSGVDTRRAWSTSSADTAQLPTLGKST